MFKPWWDGSWNPVSGCAPASAGCRLCYAARLSAGLQTATEKPIHLGTTDRVRGVPVFNGTLKELEPGHPAWTWPLTWAGADRPLLGIGKPSLIFTCDMADLFAEGRPTPIINRVIDTLVLSHHIGELLTRRTARMVEYFLAQPPKTLSHRQRKLWLGFSAERQREFDMRWSDTRDLAARGWTVFASLAPMLGPITLPPDFLALGDRAWAICSGEVGPGARPMDPSWPRSIRDQCADAGVPYFTLQMSRKASIPLDLQIWQFPRCAGGEQ